MEQRAGTGTDVITIVAEPGALTFATRKEWQKLPEMFLGDLSHHETMLVFLGTGSIFFLLRSMNPNEYLKDTGTAYRLVKVSIDEETGKQCFYTMFLSGAEAVQIMQNRLTLWE